MFLLNHNKQLIQESFNTCLQLILHYSFNNKYLKKFRHVYMAIKFICITNKYRFGI